MIPGTSGPERLYLIQVATMIAGPRIAPVPCYLIQTSDGKNILIDSGFPPDYQPDPNVPPGLERIENRKGVIEQLAMIDVRPSDIDILICTHYDVDHAGNLGSFPNALLVAQRLQHEVASTGHPRFALTRSQWDQPASQYQLVDGDTQLLPGIDLIETSGHIPGHQSVLVHLPQTGPVLLAIDAIAQQAFFTADRPASPTDADGAGAIVSTRKLLDLVEREHPSLVVFGHDSSQWAMLKQLPDFYD